MIKIIHKKRNKIIFINMKLKNIPFPKEYGSWGILLTSCVVGISVSHIQLTMSLLYVLGISLLFMVKAPLGSFMRQRNKSTFIFTTIYTVLGLVLLMPGLFQISLKNILTLSLIPFLTIILYALSAYIHKERTFIVELFAMATLTLPILFFEIISKNKINKEMVIIWFFTFIYFSASIFKVKMLIFDKQIYKISNLVYIITILIFITILVYFHIFTWLAFILFSPLLDNILSTFFHYENKKKLKLVGIIELIKGVVFAIILIYITRTPIKI